MAFYPDELSPIDRIRSLGKQTDSLPEIGSIKNRRQWKSMVLGKKDLGMNNFATIKEEKEEEMSSDGSQGANSTKGSAGALTLTHGAVTQKKIIFPKPRKYITSRVSERKEDTPLKDDEDSVPFASLSPTVKESPVPGIDVKKIELPVIPESSKTNISDPKQPPKSGKPREVVGFTQESIQNFALSETPLDSQWNDAFSEGLGLASWPRPPPEKVNVLKYDLPQGPKPKQEEKKKAGDNSKSPVVAGAARRDSKGGKNKGSPVRKNSSKTKQEISSTSIGKSKQKAEKGKTMNMKEVVNVYKNLAYGSKDEIKTFVENLSLVKDEANADIDKNLLSMMNLKALENKIKSFAKYSDKNQEASTSKEIKPKPDKHGKKNRKAHIERLARHKVIKVPAESSKNQIKTPRESEAAEKTSEHKEAKTSVKNKEPWKYVGMESVLDKTYFVYPAYPPSVNMKNTAKVRKSSSKSKGVENIRQSKGSSDAPVSKAPEHEPKVKAPQVVLRQNSLTGGGLRSLGLKVSGSLSSKSMNRPSATTVCNVEFRPAGGQKTEEPPVGATDQSLLVYLHGTKAIHVKSPYSGKQFSRVKLFRKEERGMPLIKGLGRRAVPKGCKRVSVRNISLPEKLTRVRSLDLLDFDEDIQNITDFLRSQESPDRDRQEPWQGTKKSVRDLWLKESPEERDAVASRRHRRQRRTAQELHSNHNHLFHLPHHQHGTSKENLSPDSIINEISKNIQHLQYLPDTEANRKMIGQFFDELDQQIEASKKGFLAFRKFPSPPGPDSFRPIPILGY